jgi:hypothetical protein
MKYKKFNIEVAQKGLNSFVATITDPDGHPAGKSEQSFATRELAQKDAEGEVDLLLKKTEPEDKPELEEKPEPEAKAPAADKKKEEPYDTEFHQEFGK